jgi:hypothetical protein
VESRDARGALLSVKDLYVYFGSRSRVISRQAAERKSPRKQSGIVRAVDGVELSVRRGEAFAWWASPARASRPLDGASLGCWRQVRGRSGSMGDCGPQATMLGSEGEFKWCFKIRWDR